jgi:hypothetical protein
MRTHCLSAEQTMLDQIPAQKKKNYISCKKIASFRKGMKATEKGKMSSSSYTLFAFEHENSITFSSRYRSKDYEGGSVFSDHFKYQLKIRTLKSGEKRFIFYNLVGRGVGVRTSSPNHMRGKLATLCRAQEGNRKKPMHKDPDRGLYLAQERRLLAFLRSFLKRHGISTHYLSNDPFSLMTQLCYPGTREFTDETLRKVSVGEFLLDDPVKTILRTNGKKSRRVLFSAIKSNPQAAQGLLRFAKYIRINRSLDHAQEFLEKMSQAHLDRFAQERIFSDGLCCEYGAKYLKAKQMKVFDRLSIDAIISALYSNMILNDTFSMMHRLSANEGFDFSQIEYNTIRELHDALVELTPKRRKNSFAHFCFKESNPSVQFCKKLQDEFVDNRYSICYATGTEELYQLASIMHNCAFFYYSRIKKGDYAIFCIKDDSKTKYMFGVNLYYRKDVNCLFAKLDQAVAVCNARIEVDVENELNDKIQKALAPSILYNYELRLPKNQPRTELGVNLHTA